MLLMPVVKCSVECRGVVGFRRAVFGVRSRLDKSVAPSSVTWSEVVVVEIRWNPRKARNGNGVMLEGKAGGQVTVIYKVKVDGRSGDKGSPGISAPRYYCTFRVPGYLWSLPFIVLLLLLLQFLHLLRRGLSLRPTRSSISNAPLEKVASDCRDDFRDENEI
ncbi:hypothetical protein DFS34DRAFT_92559 [Phlyctochytrium arcticum]|nr:hypothetical protein DFS34DRAFT_92559 [Phlyctochytrium arcticum]